VSFFGGCGARVFRLSALNELDGSGSILPPSQVGEVMLVGCGEVSRICAAMESGCGSLVRRPLRVFRRRSDLVRRSGMLAEQCASARPAGRLKN
jgi:hypothetical protein